VNATTIAAPAGTLTMLFTDIELSTEQVHVLGPDRWESVLERHSRIIRKALADHGGTEVRTEGDAFFAVFTSPTGAVTAAAVMQRNFATEAWPNGASPRVRMGLHTGEARPGSVAAGADYVGFEVHRAARIAAAGHGGQVLISETTESLVRDSLPAGLALVDLGRHRLKDLAPQRIYQLVGEGLRDSFPPLRSLDARPNNLPTQTTTFVGREREIAAALRRLESSRLLTLTGPGGSGKTRLALQLAASLIDRYSDGGWLIELASVTDSASVGVTIAAAMHVGERPGQSTSETLAAALRTRELLLILDNCEHLIAACAEVADTLLRACPNVVILATSREGLNVPGESLMPVPSLSIPEGDRLLSVQDLGEYEAIRLFVDRCSAFEPTFALTDENAPDVLRICRRLDGIPLALELAAARVRVLSVRQVALKLDDRFRLLIGGGRTVVARQQTLRALIDWSYDLLSDPERLLFRRLSVFVRGWTLDAAEAVSTGGGIAREAILDLLGHLVDKSLVLRQELGGVARYTMLESVREYGREKLVDSGEAPELRRRHFDHFFHSTADWWSPSAQRAVVEVEYENLRAALEWIEAEPNGGEQVLLLASGMLSAAAARGRIGELRRVLNSALARGDPSAATLGRARALLSTAILAGMQGDIKTALAPAGEAVQLLRALGQKHELAYALGNMARATVGDPAISGPALRESRALLEEVGDEWGIATMLFVMGDAALDRGDYDAARGGLTESLELFRKIGDPSLAGSPLISLGRLACVDGDFVRARALVEEALAIRKQADNPWQMAIALNSLGEIARCEGDAPRGAPSFEQALRYARDLGDDMIVSWSLHNLGHVALQTGDLTIAAARFRESLLIRRRGGPSANVAAGIAGLAGLALRGGAPDEAARLFGAVDAMLESVHGVLPPADELIRQADRAETRDRLQPETFTSRFGEGRGTSLDELDAMANEIAARVRGKVN
jgi:predicted ATPase/class 3 adenylate cyclase